MSDINLTQDEALALAGALCMDEVFTDPHDEAAILFHQQADPHYVSAMRKLWEATRDRG